VQDSDDDIVDNKTLQKHIFV